MGQEEGHIIKWDNIGVFTEDPKFAAETLVTRVKHIPAFSNCHVNINSGLREVLGALPITNKAFYQKLGARSYLESARSILIYGETSGSTGAAPFLTPRGLRDLTWNTYNQTLAYRRHLVAGQDRVMILLPSVMSPFAEVTSRALYDLNVGYMRAFPIPKVCDWQNIGRLINDYDITVIISSPTLLIKLLFEFEKLNIKTSSLKKLLLAGEHISRYLLSSFDTILDIPGAAIPIGYGSNESAALMYGRQDGDYNAFLQDFVFEILPLDVEWQAAITKTLPTNAIFGRLAVSWLRDGIMPLVRYDMGDLFSCWFDETSQDYIFRSHGRQSLNNLSPDKVQNIERAIWTGSEIIGKVAHFDINMKNDHYILNLITFPSSDQIKEKILTKTISDILQKKVQINVNPSDHRFYDFSPTLKTNRYPIH